MVEITYKKKGIRISQIWFSQGICGSAKTDILFFHEVAKGDEKGCIYQPFHTLVSDLTRDEESLYGLIQKNVRYEIRRNQKEEVDFKLYSSEEILNEPELLTEFARMYEAMYREKGIHQTLNIMQLKFYARANGLMISTMSLKNQPVVFHSYIVDKEKVRLLHSVSEFRKEDMDAGFIARCNKRLHWEDMCYFRTKNRKEYDWGGVSSLDNPNGIDAFKCKFGGYPVTYYNKYQAGSTFGKLIILLLRIYFRKRND